MSDTAAERRAARSEEEREKVREERAKEEAKARRGGAEEETDPQYEGAAAIKWQDGPVEDGVNGVTVEGALAQLVEKLTQDADVQDEAILETLKTGLKAARRATRVRETQAIEAEREAELEAQRAEARAELVEKQTAAAKEQEERMASTPPAGVNEVAPERVGTRPTG